MNYIFLIEALVGGVMTALGGCIYYLWTKHISIEHRITKCETQLEERKE